MNTESPGHLLNVTKKCWSPAWCLLQARRRCLAPNKHPKQSKKPNSGPFALALYLWRLAMNKLTNTPLKVTQRWLKI